MMVTLSTRWALRLSELNPDDVVSVPGPEKSRSSGMKLSDLSEDDVQSVEKQGVIESGIRGGLDALTLGHMDEIAGGMSHPVGAIKALIGKGSGDEDVKNYKSKRDEYRDLYERARKDNPKAYLAGGVAGSIAGPGKLLKGLKGAKAVATAAGLGGAMGEGGSKAELADKDHAGIAKDTGIGVAIGGGVQYGADKLGSALSPRVKALLDRLKNKQTLETTIEGGVPTISDAQVDTARGLGQKIFGPTKASPNASEVMDAVEQIGGKGTKTPGYMLTRDNMAQNLASTVLKDPTIPGELERRSIRPITEGLDSFGQEIAGKGSPLSAFQTGENVRAGLGAEVKKRLAPAEAIYNNIESEFAKIPINGVAFKRAMKAMRNEAKTDYSGRSEALLTKLENTFTDNIDDIAKLKEFRTKLGRNLEQSATPEERSIIGKMYEVLTRERNRSILRYEGNAPQKAGILKQLREADDIYRRELRASSEALGIEGGKRETTRQAIGSFLRETPSEDLTKKLFERGDFGGLMKMKETFPEQFEQLRQRALGELIEKSSPNGIMSPQRLVSNLSKYGPEVQELLMGELLPKAKAAKTVLGALPRNFNPSDTATKLQFLDLFNPKVQAQSFARRAVLHRKTPDAATIRQAMGPTEQGGGVRVIQKLSSSEGGGRFVQPLINAAKRGENSFGATYYLLHQTQPDFRKALESDNNQ